MSTAAEPSGATRSPFTQSGWQRSHPLSPELSKAGLFQQGAGDGKRWGRSPQSSSWKSSGQHSGIRGSLSLRSPQRSGAAKPTIGSLKVRQKVTGYLNSTDGINPLRRGCYADDFQLRGLQAGKRIAINLQSRRFDAYLELINGRTGRSLLYGDEVTLNNSNARLVFTVKKGANYIVRVSSYDRWEQGSYTLTSRETPASPPGFDFYAGYGLVNAAAAVGSAVGQPTFADVPNLGGDRWNLDLIKAPEVWAQGYTGQNVVVAVIDDGVDYQHPDLAANIWVNPGEIPGNGLDDDGNSFVDDVRGWDFVQNDNNPRSRSEHGTHVSGIIAASNDGVETTGVAYNAKIMPIRAFSNSTQTDDTQFDTSVAASIHYAVRNGAKVINMSLGNYPGDPPMSQTLAALQFATDAGVVVVIAAGNERQDYSALRPDEPALYANQGVAIAVGATDYTRTMFVDSNPAGYQPSNFVVAPGVDILSTILNNQYDYLTGTSMAAPHIAGVVALMLSANPALTPTQVTSILQQTSFSGKLKFV